MSNQDDFSMLTEEMTHFYRSGDYAAALNVVDERSENFPEQVARITFWRVCLLSLCKRAEDAIAVLAKGLDEGLWWHESLFRDSDLDNIRELTRFRELVAKSHGVWTIEKKKIQPDCTILIPSGNGPYPLLIGLHGYGGDKNSNQKYWQMACDKGWLVLMPQSLQPLYPDAYYWETAQTGVDTILFHLDPALRNYPIDAGRMVVAGMSQGGGLAALAGLSPKIQAVGSISLATWWESAAPFEAAVKNGKRTRAYFITGLKDHTLERSREIQAILKDHQIPVQEEVHPDLGHEFPPDFRKSFDEALKFLFA
jgi:predicted esterase